MLRERKSWERSEKQCFVVIGERERRQEGACILGSETQNFLHQFWYVAEIFTDKKKDKWRLKSIETGDRERKRDWILVFSSLWEIEKREELWNHFYEREGVGGWMRDQIKLLPVAWHFLLLFVSFYSVLLFFFLRWGGLNLTYV